MEQQIMDTAMRTAALIEDSVNLSTSDIVNTVGTYVDKISILETVVTVESVILVAAIMLAANFWSKVRNYKKNGVEL